MESQNAPPSRMVKLPVVKHRILNYNDTFWLFIRTGHVGKEGHEWN